MLAVVQALTGFNRATQSTKKDQSYPFHMRHLWLLHSQVMLCGVALSSHAGKVPQNHVSLLLRGVWLWLLHMSVVAFSLILSEDRGVSLSSQDGDDLTLKTAVSLSPQDRNDLTLITGQG